MRNSPVFSVSVDFFPESVEVAQRVPAYFYNVLYIDGICTVLARFKCDWQENDSFMIAGKEGGEHGVRKIIIIVKPSDIFCQEFAFHETIGCIGIRQRNTEDHAQDKT